MLNALPRCFRLLAAAGLGFGTSSASSCDEVSSLQTLLESGSQSCDVLHPKKGLSWSHTKKIGKVTVYVGNLTVPLSPHEEDVHDTPFIDLMVMMTIHNSVEDASTLEPLLIHCGGPGSDASCVLHQGKEPQYSGYASWSISQRGIGFAASPSFECEAKHMKLPEKNRKNYRISDFTDCPCALPDGTALVGQSFVAIDPLNASARWTRCAKSRSGRPVSRGHMQQPADDGDAQQGELPTVRTAARELGLLIVVVLLLSCDELNPVKVLCSYTSGVIGVSEVHFSVSAAILLAALGVNQRDHILYTCARTFFRCTFNNIFFSSVEIVGLENLPKEGPVIITGNHNNQFVDGLMLLTNCPREISFMIAQKSWDRPLVGFLARAFHCIPVARPQDMAYKGQGTITLEEGSAKARGVDTHFGTEVTPGSQVDVKGHPKLLKVKEVLSATELQLESVASSSLSGSFKVHPKVDQSTMYKQVHQSLCSGQCLGIFPEGGSHDRTDLLPLKAGVAVIALEAHSLHHLNVPIVPVGLNYFRGHQFSGRVVVEFGAPIMIPQEIHANYETNRREATEELLNLVAAAMRSVIIPTEDYKTLQQIFMVRRLWVKEGLKLSPSKAMDLNRRFAVGVHRILRLAERAGADASMLTPTHELEQTDQAGENQEPLKEEELREFQEMRTELEEYMRTLKKLGIRDHQVPQLVWWTVGDLIGRFLYLLVTLALGVIPNVMFNLPIMIVSSRFAVKEQQKSLKSSSVKLAARDVVMSYKVIYVLTCIPILYVFYGLMLWCFTDWTHTSRVLSLLSLPMFAFFGMKASEQGVRAYKDIMPLFRRLVNDEKRREQDALPAQRARLQRQLHKLVNTLGPRLGDLYYDNKVEWTKHMTSFGKEDGSRSPKRENQSRELKGPQFFYFADDGSRPKSEQS